MRAVPVVRLVMSRVKAPHEDRPEQTEGVDDGSPRNPLRPHNALKARCVMYAAEVELTILLICGSPDANPNFLVLNRWVFQ